MSVLVLDAGNSIIKGKIPRREQGELAFPHALKLLTETEYTNILARAGAANSQQFTNTHSRNQSAAQKTGGHVASNSSKQ